MTTEQILEDYVEIVAHVKATTPHAANCPVVAFGGSYGGTLTTFLRAKYPATVIGGLAASAPIGYYDKDAWAAHGVDEFTWSDIATRDYADAHPKCLGAIAAANNAIKVSPPISMLRKGLQIPRPDRGGGDFQGGARRCGCQGVWRVQRGSTGAKRAYTAVRVCA